MSTLNVKARRDREGYENRLNNALKLLNHSPDVTIEAEDGKLEVNWLLLLMNSPTLSSAISEQNSPSFSSILCPDYSIKSLRALYDLLVYGFSSSNDLSAQDFGYVLEIAKDLQIQIDEENVEMVESKACTELVSVVTKSMNHSETKIVSDFKTQDDAALSNGSNSNLNFPGSVEGSHYVEENNGEKAVYLVRCKESWGKFHHEKFVSGSKGQGIFFQEKWMTPNDFERLAGSKAKKYKDSLYVNGKPLKILVDPNGTRMATPLVKQKQFSSRSKIEGHMSILGTPVKGQGSISHYFSPKVKNQENNLDHHHNRDEISPSKVDVNVKDDMKGKFRIADIADSKKRKSTKITESKKMHLDIMPEGNVKHPSMISKGENSTKDNDKDDILFTSDDFPSDDESCTENPLIIDLNHADNCQTPIVSESNAKQIINNVFQEMMDSIQFENEYVLKKASVETPIGTLIPKFPKPVEKRFSTRYSEEQTSGLRKAFDESNYIAKEKAQELSKNLCLTENQVRDWFRKSRAKNKAVTYKTVDKLKVKTEIVDKIELHLEEKMDEEKEIKSTDTSVQKIQNDIEGLFEAYSNIENRCTCDCGVTFKNATLLKFHKHICPKKSESEANVATKGVSLNSKGESSTLDVDKDDTVNTSNDCLNNGGKKQCTCECGQTFKNAMLLKFHKHICPTATKEEL